MKRYTGSAAVMQSPWSWISLAGVERGGPAFSNASPIWQYWNQGEPNDTNDDESDHADQWGAIFAGEDQPGDMNLIYDWDANGLSSYIIEYEGALTLDGVIRAGPIRRRMAPRGVIGKRRD